MSVLNPTMVSMNKPIAVFEFADVGYDITKQSVNDILIRVWRRLRREPYVGMKQPTPHGGMLGSEVCLLIRHEGLRAAQYRFDLYCGKRHIQSGIVDNHGEYCGLSITRPYGKSYKLEINVKQLDCNTNMEVTNEYNRLVDPTTPI